jgi:hypothetical protein
MGWLSSSWQYRRAITVDNTSNPNTLSNYQVLVILDTASLISAGKMQSTGADIRFTDSDGLTSLSYWIESGINTSSTRIWVKVPNIPGSSTKTIYLYYGNPSASPASNGANTWLFFENWEGSRSANWVDGGGFTSADWEYATPGLQDCCRLHFKTGRSGSEWDNMWWKGQTFSNFRFIALVRADYSDDDSAIYFRSNGTETGTTRNLNNGYIAKLPRAGDQNFYLIKSVSGNITTLASYSAVNTSDTVRFEVLAFGPSIQVKIERPRGTYLTTLSATDTSFSSGYIGLGAPEWNSSRNPSFDMFCVGNYSSPDPSISVSTIEETLILGFTYRAEWIDFVERKL